MQHDDTDVDDMLDEEELVAEKHLSPHDRIRMKRQQPNPKKRKPRDDEAYL